MNKLKHFSLLVVLVIMMPLASVQKPGATVAITLERTACFRTCPIYTISIFEDGTVIYKGENFVQVTGEQTSEIAPETVKLMIESFKNAGYFDWNEAYDTQTVSDLSTVITSVTRDGKTHRIVRYTGDTTAPLALPFLEQWIDEMVNSQLWTGIEPNVSAVSNGVDTPLITLQRRPGFGFHPVYNVAAFEDGTIVYMGIANVKEIGVSVFKIEASMVTALAQRAQIVGYFNWQDGYEARVVTDQTTVITSIRWQDHFKRIVRYDGDPNAPIGLVRIEESISQFVTTKS